MDDAFLILTLWFLLVVLVGGPPSHKIARMLLVPRYWHIPKSRNKANVKIVTLM